MCCISNRLDWCFENTNVISSYCKDSGDFLYSKIVIKEK